MIYFHCASCGALLPEDEQYAGCLVPCPSCKRLNEIPRQPNYLVVAPSPAPERTSTGRSRQTRGWIAAAVIFSAGIVIGALVVGFHGSPPRPSAEATPLEAQLPDADASASPSVTNDVEKLVRLGVLKSVPLPNGFELSTPTVRRGLGTLTVENGNAQDAVAALFDIDALDTQPALRAIYVKAHQTATMRHVATGTYSLRFILGDDWDSAMLSFRTSLSLMAFDHALTWAEQRDSGGTTYVRQHVTLQPVPDGSEPVHRITADSFSLVGLQGNGG